mmetsp:Transcript_10905/g.26172  ORF Transcript_10905/g.26172 Transcript_10905/m.26172 type:complete len:351 (-) Transcript_10905:2267-3319(-)
MVQHSLQGPRAAIRSQPQTCVVHRLCPSMEGGHARDDARTLQARDHVALLEVFWVSAAGHRHSDRASVLGNSDGRVWVCELPLRAGEQDVVEVTFQQWEDSLGLRVAKAAVEFNHLRTAGRNHQAGKEAADERFPFCAQTIDGWLKDLRPDLLQHLRLHHRGGGESSHPAGVRSPVSIEGTLVVLCWRQHRDAVPVAERQHRALRPEHAFLEDDLCTCIPKLLVLEHLAHSGLGLLNRLWDHNALASRKSAGLHNNVKRHRVDVLEGGIHVFRREGLVLRCGNVVPLHEILGEGLGGLDLRRRLVGPEDWDVLCAELVGEAVREHLLWAHHDQAHVVLAAESDDLVELRR